MPSVGGSIGRKHLGSLVALLLAIGLLAASQPLQAAALPIKAGSSVSARAAAVYDFSAPPGGMLASGRSSHHLGAFQVGSLFLHEGEQLQIVIVATPFSKSGGSGGTVPFEVRFTSPGLIGMSNSGESYDLGIVLDRRALVRAGSGDFHGSLGIKVLTYPDGAVVWSDTINLSFERPTVAAPYWRASGWPGNSAGGALADGTDEPGDAADNPPEDGDGVAPGQGAGSGTGEASGQTEKPSDDDDAWWIQLLANPPWLECCTPIFLLLLLLLVRRRRKKKDEPDSQLIE